MKRLFVGAIASCLLMTTPVMATITPNYSETFESAASVNSTLTFVDSSGATVDSVPVVTDTFPTAAGIFLTPGVAGFTSSTAKTLTLAGLNLPVGDAVAPVKLTFDTIDVSGHKGVSVSINAFFGNLDTVGADKDTVKFSLVGDMGYSASKEFGTDFANGDNTALFLVPDAVTTLTFTIEADGIGNAGDFFQLDNFSVLGIATQSVPEPTAFLFGSLVAAGVGVVVARKRRA